ncbi:MAG TPA: hypothetical protein VMU84_08755 [Thermoanaerobaculia bacterium]|nr:hypothetical protein [Thermoanaerobaculia bacterium]
MTRLVWFVLNDGRSVVAACDAASKESIGSALAKPNGTLTLTSDDRVDHIASRDVRDFVLFEARSAVPPAAAIYRFVHV